MSSTPWLAGSHDKPEARIALVCFGSAGSGGSHFAAWNRLTPAWLRIVRVQLPGREARYREVPSRDWRALVHRIGEAVALLTPQVHAFFGHSFGALLAFETARWLRRNAKPLPRWFCVAGRPAPHLPDRYRKTYALPDAELVEVLRGYGGTDRRILEAPEALRLFLPAIRADLEINAEYVYRPETPLTVPITAVRGIEDPVCDSDRLAAWRELTAGPFELHEWEGTHFFYRQSLDRLLATIVKSLVVHVPPEAQRPIPENQRNSL